MPTLSKERNLEYLQKNMQISFNDIDPFIRYAGNIKCDPGYVFGPRKLFDHQFLYVHHGEGTIIMDEEKYDAVQGDLFFYKPAVLNTVIAHKKNPCILTGIHFDFINPCSKEYGKASGLEIQEPFDGEVEFSDFDGFFSKMSICHDHKIGSLMMDIAKEFESKRLNYNIYIKGLFFSLLSIVSRHVINQREGLEEKTDAFNELNHFLQAHYCENLTNADIAARFHFHPNYLSQLMVANTGKSLHQYILDLRMKKAMSMLMYSDTSISEISEAVGFTDIHYFSRHFKKKTGFNPRQVRENTAGVC